MALARMPQPLMVRLMASGVRLSPSIWRRAAMAPRRFFSVVEAGRRKNYYQHPKEDAIIMTLEFQR